MWLGQPNQSTTLSGKSGSLYKNHFTMAGYVQCSTLDSLEQVFQTFIHSLNWLFSPAQSISPGETQKPIVNECLISAKYLVYTILMSMSHFMICDYCVGDNQNKPNASLKCTLGRC